MAFMQKEFKDFYWQMQENAKTIKQHFAVEAIIQQLWETKTITIQSLNSVLLLQAPELLAMQPKSEILFPAQVLPLSQPELQDTSQTITLKTVQEFCSRMMAQFDAREQQ